MLSCACMNKTIKITCTGTELIDINRLTPLQGNLKEKSKEQLQKLKNQILKHGFSFPLFIWRNGKDYTLDGHGRDFVCKELLSEGYLFQNGNDKPSTKISADFIQAKDKKEAKEKLLALNSSFGTITNDGLYEFLNEPDSILDFDSLKLDLELPNIDLEKFEIGYMKDVDEEKLDDIPEVQKEAISKLGDIFLIDGRHKIMCGDSTKKEDVEKLMDGKKANLLMTSPPYWVGKDYEKEKNENEIDGFVKRSVESLIIAMNKNYSRIIINTGTGMATRIGEKKTRVILLLDKWINELYKYKWYLRNIRHWIKGGGGIGTPISPATDYVYSGMEYLLTLYNIEGKQRGQNKIGEPWCQQSNWDDIRGDRQENKAGFPVELPIRFIKLYSLINEKIIDNFLGNGTTLIACEQTNRICYGMEIDPIYIDVILRRYHTLYSDKEIKCLTNPKYNFKKLFNDRKEEK